MKYLPFAMLFVSVSVVSAAELPKEGSYDYTACWSGVNNTIAFSKGYNASSYEMTGTILTNPPGGIFDSLASDGSLTRETVAGSGKYEGMTVTGTVHPLGSFPVIKAGTFQDCNHQTGTYKLK